MQWIRDTSTDNAVLKICNKWDNFKGNSNFIASTYVFIVIRALFDPYALLLTYVCVFSRG